MGRTRIVDLSDGTIIVVLVAPDIRKGAVLGVYASRVIEHDGYERRRAMHSIQLYSFANIGNELIISPKNLVPEVECREMARCYGH